MSVSYDTDISPDENLLAATGLGSGDVLLPSGVAKADVAPGRGFLTRLDRRVTVLNGASRLAPEVLSI